MRIKYQSTFGKGSQKQSRAKNAFHVLGTAKSTCHVSALWNGNTNTHPLTQFLLVAWDDLQLVGFFFLAEQARDATLGIWVSLCALERTLWQTENLIKSLYVTIACG